MNHPYTAGLQRYQGAQDDFGHFATYALVAIPEILKTIARAGPLEQANGFLVRRTSSVSFQAWFGKRPSGRPLIEGGGMDVEDGAYLVYSLGANGLVAAVLYPAKSEGATAREKYLVLGFWEPGRLEKELAGHLHALVAYQYVTSIDGRPTLAERMRVWWLRLVCLREIDGQQSVATREFFGWLAGMATRGVFAGIAGKVFLAAVILLLIWLGRGELAAMLG